MTDTKKSPRTLIVGLDGATFDLLDPWIKAGDLPTIERLMHEGSFGVLHAYPNMNSAVAWSAIATGCNPGKHGVYDFGDTLGTRDNKWHPVTARDRQRDPFWRLLSDAGQGVSVINMPISYPADAINGFMISGMDAPGIDIPGAMHPVGLLEELRTAGINYVLDVPKLSQCRDRNPYQLPESVVQMVTARTQTVLHLMDRRTWDTFMVVYTATDRMQHTFWGHSQVPPTPDGSPLARSWEPLRQLYKLLDGHIAELLAKAGKDANVIVISDHGFGPSQSNVHKLNKLFEAMGWVKYRQTRKPTVQGQILKNLLVYGRRILPPPLQYALATRLPSMRQRAVSATNFGDIDWENTKVVAHPRMGSVYINLQGVWPQGIVTLEEYDDLSKRVRQVLKQLTDPATGRPLAENVHLRSEVYNGPNTDRAPDILIEWDRDVQATGMRLEADGQTFEFLNSKRSDKWNGSHRSEGIFIAHGPLFEQGVSMGRITQYDIAPTTLYLQQQPLPDDLDGRVLTELFDASQLAGQPVRYAGASAVPVMATPELDAAEEAEIESRLRDLGYIE